MKRPSRIACSSPAKQTLILWQKHALYALYQGTPYSAENVIFCNDGHKYPRAIRVCVRTYALYGTHLPKSYSCLLCQGYRLSAVPRY